MKFQEQLVVLPVKFSVTFVLVHDVDGDVDWARTVAGAKPPSASAHPSASANNDPAKKSLVFTDYSLEFIMDRSNPWYCFARGKWLPRQPLYRP
jgi:hypothetical protein